MADVPPVTGRLAPSPTGRLHLGHARTFLAAWWSARSRGGRVVLRIEDLDADRVKEGATDLVLRDLEWLELDWDGVAMVQSERKAAHAEALDGLVARGLAYPCVCTRREIDEAASAPHADGGEVRYPGTCRGRFSSVAAAREETGREPALRLSIERVAATTGGGGTVARFLDLVQGEVSVDVSEDVGDFVVRRKDGVAAYQLATPLDDAEQAVTEVVRGDDLVPSAGRQALVARALGLPFPAQAHVPLVVDADGARLAKRAGSLALGELRAAGVDPARIRAWAAESLGAPGAAEGRGEGFDWAAVPREPARLPRDPIAALRGL